MKVVFAIVACLAFALPAFADVDAAAPSTVAIESVATEAPGSCNVGGVFSRHHREGGHRGLLSRIFHGRLFGRR